MLLLLISLFRRKRAFRWSPAVDLSDPYIAAALAPMTHSLESRATSLPPKLAVARRPLGGADFFCRIGLGKCGNSLATTVTVAL